MAALLAFVRLTRPLFLFGGFAGVALGAAVAAWTGVRLDAVTYAWAQCLVTAFQLMVHYANDYFDRDGDVVDGRTAWSGGSGVLPSGALRPQVALVAALVCAALGLAISARFVVAGNAVAGAIGVVIFALAWSYSAPPLRLAARGLGELDTALVVSALVPAVVYAALGGRLNPWLLDATVSPAIAMYAMMLGVELPDAAVDAAAGKRNLVVRWGPAKSAGIIGGLGVGAVLLALQTAFRVLPVTALALVPATAIAAVLFRTGFRDPRPPTLAFLGVALYAALTVGLAAAFGVAAALR